MSQDKSLRSEMWAAFGFAVLIARLCTVTFRDPPKEHFAMLPPSPPVAAEVAAADREANAEQRFDLFLRAVRLIESGGNVNAVGAAGEIGPYQIRYSYYADAAEQVHQRSGIEVPPFEVACRDEQWSRVLIVAYMHRYCPEAMLTNDFETMARTHNGGPRGPEKPATEEYWRRVRALMKELNP